MTDTVNFQWQNPNLLQTIYPLREMKLRDFLVYYFEFEIWETYQARSLDDIEVKRDIDLLKRDETRELRVVHKDYHDQLAYFLGTELDFSRADRNKPIQDQYVRRIDGERVSFKRNFPTYNSTRKQRFYLESYILRMEGHQTTLKAAIDKLSRNLRNFRATDPTNTRIPVWEQDLDETQNTKFLVDTELDRLYAFFGSFNRLKDDLDLILDAIHSGRGGNPAELEALKMHEPEAVLDFLARRRPTKQYAIKDIVQWKTRQYEEDLAALDQDALLAKIVDAFLENPTKHPLWLQYMVIHFSGMRYQSAHGSWGDPKDILMSLKIKSIHDKLKTDPDDVLRAEAALEAGIISGLPGADSPETQRILDGLRSENLFVQRRTLQDVWIDKKKQVIESMNEEQVLKSLEELSDRLPPWMWKEIVSRTDLRLAHAGADWETLSEDDKEGYYDRINAEFRDILVKWKEKNLTMWRQEHDRANRLIVTRAVCNEVAEHIQHLRGITPPGGLTAKPQWYLNEQKAAESGNLADRPFFRKIRSFSDFRSGASIFWLSWVNGRPNIWRITNPLELPGGEGLLPAGMVVDRSERVVRAQRNELKKGHKVPWVVDIKDNAFRRRRYTAALESAPRQPSRPTWVVSENPEEQYLRWVHEATVVDMGDTAEGRVILTFETALPYEDKRRSTIGVFKRFASDLIYRVNDDFLNGTFTGYLPRAELPLKDLKAMLDWRKILPDADISQEKIDHFWSEVEKSLEVPAGTIESIGVGSALQQPRTGVWVESAPQFDMRKGEVAICYNVVPDGGRTGKFIDEVAKPRIELPRGLQFEITKEGAKMAGRDTYFEVLRCDAEPGAVGKYVRQTDVQDLPGVRSLPFKVPAGENLRDVRSLNDKGKPVLLPSGIKLVDGTMIRVSRVQHKVSGSGRGEGMIDVDGPTDYYLVVECPSRPVAEGLFINVGKVEAVSEEEYEAGKLSGAVGLDPGVPVKALVVPEDNGTEAALFEKEDSARAGGIYNRVWQVIPRDGEIEIGAIEITNSGKVFYPVLKYAADPGLEGFYIRRKEISIVSSA